MKISHSALPLFVFAVIVLLAACRSDDGGLSPEAIELNNRGVGLMGQYENEQARVIFAELAAAYPDWLDVRVNEAIATLNRQREGDERRALALVGEVLAVEPDHTRANYIAALMRYYLGETDQSMDHFRRVRAAAPDDAHVAYFFAQAQAQLGQVDEALELYEQAIELDPYLRSAYYGAALVLRQQGDTAAARERLAVYQRFANNPRAPLAEFRYTRKGRLAEALAVDREPDRREAPRPAGDLFAEVETVSEWSGESGPASLTTADIDGDGRQDLFLAGPSLATRVFLNHETGFGRAEDHPLDGLTDVVAAAWGDVDNDGVLDVYLCRRGANRLLSGADDWQPAPGAGDVADDAHCTDVGLFDADHDGDLDLFVVNADGPNELFSNNLDGSWRRLSETAEADLAGSDRSRAMLAGDFDGDRDADILVLNLDSPHQVLINDRLWRYRETAAFDLFRQADLRAVTAADFGASGQLALVSIDSDGAIARWQPDEEGVWRSQQLATVTLGERTVDLDSVALAALDFRGDGRPDLLVRHARGFEVLALDEDSERLVSAASFGARLDALAPVLLDAWSGPALFGLTAGPDARRLVQWPPGPGRGAFAALAPTGRSDRSGGMRSNASGIGTGLVARAGSRWAIADTFDRHSAPGQSLQPVAIGLGGERAIDFVKLYWSDGVLQTEMELAAGQIHTIAETQRQLASCPVLFAFNGREFEFVSDLLGVAGIGFLRSPGQYAEPRPWEYFRFPAGSIAPRDGSYAIKIGEPMEEVAYLDLARLHVHDLPPGWAVALDERMHTGGGPAPTGAPVFYREANVLE
ncbi:MAG: FG-GAP-like repeat-containing protein, partial [Wenzhouxiangella sp.]|nr:FG-GAP-like repeat-containing protein [Wenzhouxiangella sp.]